MVPLTVVSQSSGPAMEPPVQHAGSSAGLLGLELLDSLPICVLLVDREARVVHANRAGAALLSAGAGMRKDAHGRCCAGTAATTFVLRGKIAEAATNSRHGYLTLPFGDEPASAACILPVGPGHPRHCAILVGRMRSECQIPHDLLVDLYGLTPAEAQLAVSLCNGQRLEGVARARGVTIHTVRSQLHQIFAKLDVTRQAEVVRLILSGPGALPAPG